jgi:predicted transposase/invertase (TIGR01784 family)
MTPEELEMQQKRHAFIQIQRTGLELAEEKGRAEGIELGKQERELEIARNLLDVLDDATIALKTGLTVEQIQSLRG